MALSRNLLLVLVAGLLVADGYATGRWSGRWGDGRELTQAVERLQHVPLTVGDWKGTAQELNPAVVEQAGFRGYILRRYENSRTGSTVNVLVACGRPGPLSVHTPEVCYGGAGFALEGSAARGPASDWSASSGAEFWKATFGRQNGASPEKLRVIWAWYYKGNWHASGNPRWTFMGSPVLYKLYVSQSYLPQNEATDGEGADAFLREFLPALEKEL
jgi:hypothetical protein